MEFFIGKFKCDAGSNDISSLRRFMEIPILLKPSKRASGEGS
jgi:hypothetical protein